MYYTSFPTDRLFPPFSNCIGNGRGLGVMDVTRSLARIDSESFGSSNNLSCAGLTPPNGRPPH